MVGTIDDGANSGLPRNLHGRVPKVTSLEGHPLICWDNWYMRLRELTTSVLGFPPLNWAWWSLRTLPITTGIVVVLCVIHGIVAYVGDPVAARAAFGQRPGDPVSWFTHALLHDSIWHLAFNGAVFWISGGLVELCLGRNKLAVLVVLVAPAAAVMAAIAAPGYWETNANPIGFSAVSNATFVLGVYLGTKVVGFWLARWVPDTMLRGRLQALPWSVIGTVVALAVTLAWLHHGIGGEWGDPDAAPRVAHSFGMLSGLTAVGIVAVNGRSLGDRSLSRFSVGLAITVMVIVAIQVAF